MIRNVISVPKLIKIMMLFALSAANTTSATTNVTRFTGWLPPSSDWQDVPDRSMGSHPILGKFACPSLVQFSGDTYQHELNLLQSVAAIPMKKEIIWRLQLKSGIRWWNGAPVKLEEVKSWLEDGMQRFVQSALLETIEIPDFEVSTKEPGHIEIVWEEQPKFGPYVLHDQPLTLDKKSFATAYTCTGEYAIRSIANQTIELQQISSGKTVRIELLSSSSNRKETDANEARLTYASDFGGSPWVRMSDQPSSCKEKIDLPVFTILNWNPSKEKAGKQPFRLAMTNLLPRGELTRAGAGYMGSVISTIIPRSHPGYDHKITVHDYSVAEARNRLAKLGYLKSKPSHSELSKENFSLTIATSSESKGLLRKVIVDSFTPLGIGVKFSHTDDKNSDAELLSLGATDPTFNWLPTLHSSARKDGALLFPPKDEDLDRLLVRYALDVTNEVQPDFGGLRDIHKHLATLEPFSVLIQHRACLTSGKSFSKRKEFSRYFQTSQLYDAISGRPAG